MATAKDVIKIALAYNGTKASPPGNVLFNTEYYGGKVSGKRFAWCAVYVWFCFRKAKAAKLFFNGKKTAYVPAIETYAKKKEKVIAKDKGRLGDVVLFDFSKKGSSGHVGFILKKNTDGTYTTIEGNTSPNNGGSQSNGGCVAIKTRKQSQIRMIYRPDYDIVNPEPAPSYKVGNMYILCANMNCRTKASINGEKLCLLKIGEQVTCRQIKKVGKSIWMKTDKGWFNAYYNGQVKAL